MLLPFRFRGHGAGVGVGAGAKRSDGSFVRDQDLFQHGYKPFGGDMYRPQRVERRLSAGGGLWRKVFGRLARMAWRGRLIRSGRLARRVGGAITSRLHGDLIYW